MTPHGQEERQPLRVTWRDRRLRLHSDFQRVQKHGTSRAHPLLVLRAVRNGLPRTRFGLAVGRRVARKAVIRNRIRRRIREVARQSPLASGWDLLFIARPAMVEATYAETRLALEGLLVRFGVLSKSPETATEEQ